MSRNAEPVLIHINREIAELRAKLFRLDPTPERLTAWADAYAQLPEASK